MTCKIVLLSLFTAASVSAAPVTACNDANTMKIMQGCYTTFIGSYGIDDPFPLAEFFSGFHRNRTNLLEEEGIAAKPDMKVYGVALTECLAPVADCIEDLTYEMEGLGAQALDGHKYNTDRLITAYQTSDRGYEIQMRHFYCLRQCADEFGDDADKCDADLAKTEKQCKDYSANMQCFREIYSKCCGPEGGEFQCNSVGAEYKIFMKAELASGECKFDACA